MWCDITVSLPRYGARRWVLVMSGGPPFNLDTWKISNMDTITIPFMIGTRVVRLGSEKDYTVGRIGEVVEVKGDRRRVSWDTDPQGNAMKPIRTWVNVKFLSHVAKQSTRVE